MARYRVALSRKASATKSLDSWVREFGFDASGPVEAIARAEDMRLFPASDDCDMAMLIAPDGARLWVERRHA
jgi:hypothetical protein